MLGFKKFRNYDYPKDITRSTTLDKGSLKLEKKRRGGL